MSNRRNYAFSQKMKAAFLGAPFTCVDFIFYNDYNFSNKIFRRKTLNKYIKDWLEFEGGYYA